MGEPNNRGNSSKDQLKKIYSTQHAFAAIDEDNNVIKWGNHLYGGDSTNVKDKLKNIKYIYSTNYAFAAIDKDNNVITWGEPSNGGDFK